MATKITDNYLSSGIKSISAGTHISYRSGPMAKRRIRSVPARIWTLRVKCKRSTSKATSRPARWRP